MYPPAAATDDLIQVVGGATDPGGPNGLGV